jgi:hypothetical protein
VNTVVMFFSVRTKKLPFRLLQVRWLDTAGFAGFGIHAPTMVEPKRGGSALVAGHGRVRRVWNTRTNHGRAQERRVCVLSTRTSPLRTSKPSMPANFGAPRRDTRIHLTTTTPRALPRAHRQSKPSSTTSTSYKGATNSQPSSATPLKNMVNSLGRFSAEPASLTPSGTSPLQSPPSSWPSRNTSPDRSPVTPTKTMTPTMTLPPPMNRMIEPEYLFVFVGSVQGIFFFYVPPGFLRGGHVTHTLSSLPGLASFFLNQLN